MTEDELRESIQRAVRAQWAKEGQYIKAVLGIDIGDRHPIGPLIDEIQRLRGIVERAELAREAQPRP